MFKESIFSLRKVRMNPSEKEVMLSTLNTYMSVHPVIEKAPNSLQVLWSTLLRILKGDMFIRS